MQVFSVVSPADQKTKAEADRADPDGRKVEPVTPYYADHWSMKVGVRRLWGHPHSQPPS